MVIDFDFHRQKQVERAAYRLSLVEQIVEYHRLNGQELEPDSFYMTHVKSGFPIHILENIVARLQNRRVSSL